MGSILKYIILAGFCGGLLFFQAPVIARSLAAQSAVNQELKIDFPEITNWEKGELERYPTPALGYSVGYNHSKVGGALTIYVYDGGLKSIPDGIGNDPVKGQFTQAKSDIQQMGKLGRYQNVKQLSDDTVMLGGKTGKIRSLHSVFTFTIRNNKGQDYEVISEIYIFGYKNNFIKFRVTRPKESGEEGTQVFGELLAELEKLFVK